MRIALVSCVKTKRGAPHPAKDLYTSPLFLGLRRYAETHADRWFILSAKHGLLDPDQVIEPYEATLNTMGVRERRQWAENVKSQLVEVLPPDAEVIVLAGERYRKDLLPFLRRRGHRVTVPLEGVRFGKQLQYLGTIVSPEPTPADDANPRLPDSQRSRVRERGSPSSSFSDPVLSRLTSRDAVISAITEFDELGREGFLEKYGFGPVRRYFLEHNSRHYDSKAIVGAAYGSQHPKRGPLKNSEFGGGRSTVQRKLEELGFSLFVFPES